MDASAITVQTTGEASKPAVACAVNRCLEMDGMDDFLFIDPIESTRSFQKQSYPIKLGKPLNAIIATRLTRTVILSPRGRGDRW